tara:strand:- start:3713 stop:4402 length:690 start_codon:yes stop_codon:yes gene_type:complete
MKRSALVLLVLAFVAGEYADEAQGLRQLNIRSGVIDLKFAYFQERRSEEQGPEFYKFDPFVIPSSIPAELLPDKESKTQPEAILASSAAQVAIGFRFMIDIVGVMGFNGNLQAVFQDKGSGSTNLFSEGSKLGPFGVGQDFNPETNTMRTTMGIVEVGSISPTVVEVRFGAYFEDDPTMIIWRNDVFYLRSPLEDLMFGNIGGGGDGGGGGRGGGGGGRGGGGGGGGRR